MAWGGCSGRSQCGQLIMCSCTHVRMPYAHAHAQRAHRHVHTCARLLRSRPMARVSPRVCMWAIAWWPSKARCAMAGRHRPSGFGRPAPSYLPADYRLQTT